MTAGPPYPVWSGEGWVEVPVPPDGEVTVVPNVNALIYRGTSRDEVLLQRRDKPDEAVRGRWELPGGRWRAGERPDVAIAREVREETCLELLAVAAAIETVGDGSPRAAVIARPLAVVNGIDGAYPSLHVLFECYAEGDPVPLVGETTDPTWWRVDDLRAELDANPDAFVTQTRAMLRAAFG
ncbi:MAG TPA: NUDIX hydrolase [Acidimicrobiia bacterium]|jgi:8-oxo-dGTP diphosphatase